MDSKQNGLGFEEEEILIEGQAVQQGMDEENDASEASEVDQLLPQPVFYIEEEHQNLTQEEKDAFTYIMSVRSQKVAILQRHPHKNQESIGTHDHLPKQAVNAHQPNIHEESLEIMNDWKKETVQNWRLVVQNLKYLQKISEKEKYIKEKLNFSMLFLVPEAYKLCLNKSLNLCQIQKNLVQFSNAYYERVVDKIDSFEKQAPNFHFHLWIYSLLALHQCYASYTNFQALASINAVIEKEAQLFECQLKSSNNDFVSQNFNQIIKWSINLILLIEVFHQNFLKKHLYLVKKCGLI